MDNVGCPQTTPVLAPPPLAFCAGAAAAAAAAADAEKEEGEDEAAAEEEAEAVEAATGKRGAAEAVLLGGCWRIGALLGGADMMTVGADWIDGGGARY